MTTYSWPRLIALIKKRHAVQLGGAEVGGWIVNSLSGPETIDDSSSYEHTLIIVVNHKTHEVGLKGLTRADFLAMQNASGAYLVVRAEIAREESATKVILENVEIVALSFSSENLRGHKVDEYLKFSARLDHVTRFSKMNLWISDHLGELGCTETPTPTLVANPGMEINIEPFKVQCKFLGKKLERYLPTSPELTLKKYLSKGMTDIFEIRSCFRNNEVTDIHSPEFKMLEIYHAHMSLDLFMQSLETMIISLAKSEIWASKSKIRTVKRESVPGLFKRILDFDLKPKATLQDLKNCCVQNKVEFLSSDSWSDLFDRLMLEKIEPEFKSTDLLFLIDYPAQVAALSRIKAGGYSGRFEIYMRGVEVGNGFDELTDANEQRRRMEQEYKLRVEKYGDSPPIDEEFLSALSTGVPQCVGIAIGLDRLYMVLSGLTDIKDLSLCPR